MLDVCNILYKMTFALYKQNDWHFLYCSICLDHNNSNVQLIIRKCYNCTNCLKQSLSSSFFLSLPLLLSFSLSLFHFLSLSLSLSLSHFLSLSLSLAHIIFLSLPPSPSLPYSLPLSVQQTILQPLSAGASVQQQVTSSSCSRLHTTNRCLTSIISSYIRRVKTCDRVFSNFRNINKHPFHPCLYKHKPKIINFIARGLHLLLISITLSLSVSLSSNKKTAAFRSGGNETALAAPSIGMFERASLKLRFNRFEILKISQISICISF